MKKKEKNTPKEKSPEVVAPRADYSRRRTEIEVSKLKPAPWNPRTSISDESVADLAASIASLGMIQPVVALNDGTLIAGHRRLAAAKLAGLKVIPCDIIDVDEKTARRMTFIENLQRKDADPLLESSLVGGLVEAGMTQEEIAAETGRGTAWVARRMNLVNLSPAWRKRVEGGEDITVDCLEHIASYPREIQERLRKVSCYSRGALRWSDVKNEFDCETCDLSDAIFDRAACRTCPKNTGCSPDLFDWEGKRSAFGRCMDRKCFKRKRLTAIEKQAEEAKADGCEVVRLKNSYPPYASDYQKKRDSKHCVFYVWTDYFDEIKCAWGKPLKKSKAGKSSGGGMSENEKSERRQKIAQNKARRKLSGWCCGGGLKAAILAMFPDGIPPHVPFAIERAFYLDNYRIPGTSVMYSDAGVRLLLGAKMDVSDKWARVVSQQIGEKMLKENGLTYAIRVIAIFGAASDALTEEERGLIVSPEELSKIRSVE